MIFENAIFSLTAAGRRWRGGMLLFLFIFFYPLFGYCAKFSDFWDNLWKTKDQQAAFYMQQKDYKKASQTFQNKSWQGAALYKAQDYKKAAQVLETQKDVENQYNLANTLAHLNQYQQAIDIYNAILKQNPNHKDATFNRDLLKKLLEQQQNQSQDSNQNDNQQKKPSNQEQEEQNKNQQKSENKNKQDNKNHHDDKQPPEETKNNADDPQEKPTKTQDQAQDQAQQKQEQEQQANKQWLKLIPDDPGGLLKQQFLRDHLRRTSQDEK